MSELGAVSSLFDLSPRCLPAWLKRLVSDAVYFYMLLLAAVEGHLFSGVGNISICRVMCLPSSNVFFTSQALAVMYGALANGGVVEIVDKAAAPGGAD